MSIHAAVQPAPFAKKLRPIEKAMANTVALIVAAGRGERPRLRLARPQSNIGPGRQACAALDRRRFCFPPAISAVQVVIREEDREYYEAAIKGLMLLPAVAGGATRQHSVRHGLEALPAPRRTTS
jgi:2-C-methyl-D-erythritol 4-phosphate cytidylyltransferase/2-C-methyl-D-erythritol 2,4-cyclodiphosphate synthase